LTEGALADRRYDAVVVGGGPAGFSAATWLARHRRHVVLIDSGERRNRWVERTHGYLGLDPVHPQTLLERARAGLLAYPTAELMDARVQGVEARPDDAFLVRTGTGDVATRRLVLATGVEDRFPEVENFFEHYGASVFHCPTCDGYEARDRHIVVFGWSQHVAGFALGLLNWAADVTIVTDGTTFEGDAACRANLEQAAVEVIEDDAVAFIGPRGDLQGVRLRGGRTIACELAFFSIAHRPRSELAVMLGCALTDEGCVAVDEHNRTTVGGVYACGDVVPGLQLVQVAAAGGTVAGVACAQSLA
jgi:thioredoxin reductase